ncbi:hypothetical protein [Photobacterium angustum]|uniref:hypothetical protein n=1 Tax=Photobacterium angustum TaxID=661 RepID=UPI0005DFC871|nr:hypothetical protein [Photobacterium angustum]KJG00101.1 hypothetical protein UB35_19815 [Photobacterium angustum]PSV61702.1 hypothetical protein CTM95_20585 [Photobacterium angustum]
MFKPLQLSEIEERNLSRELVERSEKLDRDFSLHKHTMIYCSHGEIDTAEPCYLSPTRRDFELPSKEQLRLVTDHIQSLGYSMSDISRLIGARPLSLSHWLSDNQDKQINKSNWVLLTQLAGLTYVAPLANLNLLDDSI